MANIAVIGAGTWGTALAALLIGNGHNVTLWAYLEEEKRNLESTRQHPNLKGITLPETLAVTTDLKEACADRDLIVMAVPSTATRATAHKMNGLIPDGQQIITVSKGIEEGTLLSQCEIIEEELPTATVGILSGPSHAEEVIKKLPAAVVAGAKDRRLAVFAQELFMNDYFRVYTSPDVHGIEVGGSLKNVIALAAGMSDGLAFGDNARAALMTRGIKEISALAQAMGGEPETLSGLTGIGDLIVTCSSEHSRNHTAGYYIGQGMDTESAMKKVNMVVEGVHSAKAAQALGEKYGIELPIINAVNEVLFDGKAAADAVTELMTRNKKSEIEGMTW